MSTSAELEAAGPSGRQETANGNPSDQPAEMAMEVAEQPGTSMRVLALYCTSSSAVPEQDQGFDPPDACNINHLAARPGIEVGQWTERDSTATTQDGCTSIMHNSRCLS